MCFAHYQRWMSGARGEVLNRGRLLHAKNVKKRPLEEILKEICRVQAEVINDQERKLHAAALIISFASMEIRS